MNPIKLTYKPLGGIAILIEWSNEINTVILEDISLLRNEIHSNLNEFVLETVPAYNSLTIFFDTGKIKYASIVKKIRRVVEKRFLKKIPSNKTLWKIPVCYNEEFGFDLDIIAKSKNLSKQHIIKSHCSAIYDVFFIGFLPGFLYLGGLPTELHFNRKSKPRSKIKKGAVGIAGSQTGIYPRESPGGWNIIGNSPISFFDVSINPPCFAKTGDKLHFFSVDKKKYNKIKEQVEIGEYLIENEVYGL